jgi:D-3-phosphoglycerate dehydrogenase
MAFRVLIADTLPDAGLKRFDSFSQVQVTNAAGITPADLRATLGDYHGLVVRSRTQVTADLLNAGGSLQVVGRAGIGVDNIDLKAATRNGVVVMNTPDGNATTTAEHTVSLIMAMARRIPQANASMRAGAWEKKKFVGTELSGKTLGVLGLGNIGRIVADRAQGLHMKVVGFDPFFNAEAAKKLGVEFLEFDEVLRRADILTVHTPLNDDTRNMISDPQIALMKPGVMLVNCARGGIYDETALLRGLECGQIRSIALDVFVEEPPENSPLVAHPRVIATPHLGASTSEAQLQVAVDVAQQIGEFASGEPARNAVNMPRISAADLNVLGPYLPLAMSMGSFLCQLVNGAVSSVAIQMAGDIASRSSIPVGSAVLTGVLSQVLDRPVNAVNARILAEDRGVKVEETRSSASRRPYASTLEVTLESADGSRHCLVGTVFAGSQGRIVKVDDTPLEVIPKGHILMIRNRNRPGVIGRIGTRLGERGINIAGMHLGLKGDEALSLVNVDEDVPADVLESLCGGDVLWVRQVVL